MNCRVSMWRDIQKLKLKNKVLDNCCVVYSLWERIQDPRRANNKVPRENGRVKNTSPDCSYLSDTEVENVSKK
mgnify:CR=1 FL=1